MKTLSNWIPGRRSLIIPPVLLGIMIVLYLAWSSQPLPRVEPEQSAIPVDVVQVDETAFRPSVVGYGTAKPKNIWTAVAEVGGNVVEIHPSLRNGNRIGKDEVLLRIDPTDYELRMRQREAELAQGHAQLEELEKGLESDRESLELQQRLLEVRQQEVDRLNALRGNAAASQSESDSARAAYLQQALSVESLRRTIALAPSKVASAKAAIQIAQSKVDEARRDLERTTIRAPLDGLMSGETIQQYQYLAPGQVLFELHGTNAVEIEAQFSIAQMSRLVVMGDSDSRSQFANSGELTQLNPDVFLQQLAAKVTVRSGDVAVTFAGTPIRLAGTIDEATRTIGIIVEVTSAGQLDQHRKVALRSGAYCEVHLETRQLVNGILIPRTAVRRGNESGDDAVFVVDQQQRLQRLDVDVQARHESNYVVMGIPIGSMLVANPSADFIEGVLVAPVMPNSTSEEGAVSEADRPTRETDRPTREEMRP